MVDSPREIAFAPGALIAGRYQVLGKLGEGGMGMIYRVQHVSTGAQHALKTLHPELGRSPKIRERFVREGQLSAKIASDHVVKVVDAGVDETGVPFLVMELLDGATLEDVVTLRQRLSPGVVVAVFEQLCHALAAAHAVGILHRDIKPANIFLARRRDLHGEITVKVLDFGIAKVLVESAAGQSTIQAGSTAWAPPEQWDPRTPPTPAIDVWPLGLLAFWMLTGLNYWESENERTRDRAPGILAEVLGGPIVRASERLVQLGGAPVSLPPQFDDFFACCVSREPSRRFKGPGAVSAVLSQLFGPAAKLGAELLPPRTPTPLRPPPPVVAAPIAPRSSGPYDATEVRQGAGGAGGGAPEPRGAQGYPATTTAPSLLDPSLDAPVSLPLGQPSRRGLLLALGGLGALAVAGVAGIAARRVFRPTGLDAEPSPAASAPAPASGAAPAGVGSAERPAGASESSKCARWERRDVLGAIKARAVLRVGVENEAPPLNMGVTGDAFVDGATVWRGFDHDIVKTLAGFLAKDLGLPKLEVRVFGADFAELPCLLADDKVDIVMGGQVRDDEAKALSWSDPYLGYGLCLIVRMGDAIRRHDDLKSGKRLGIYKGDAVARRYAEGLGLRPEDILTGKGPDGTDTDWLVNLVEERWDAALYDFPFAVAELAKPRFKGLRIIETNLTESEYVIGMPAHNPELVEALNRAIAAAFGKGLDAPLYAKIVRKSLGAKSCPLVDVQLPKSQRVYHVRDGDTLPRIARVELGDPRRSEEVWALNKSRLGNRLLLAAGDSIVLPVDP